MMTSRLPWTRIYRNADGGASGGGAPATVTHGASVSVPSAPAQPAAQPAAAPAAKPGEAAPAAKPSDPAAAALALNDQLAGNAKPDAAAMKAFMESTPEGKKAIEGKSEAEIAALYEAAKAKEAEGKKEGELTPEEKAAKEAADAEAAKQWEKPAAEIYKDIKYPEGFQVDQALSEPVMDFFKSEKIAPELAQKIVDMHLKTIAASEAEWMGEINNQFDAFQKDGEFWKDGKLTTQAEQAYGAVRAISPEVQKFFAFLNKNGGLFHPGFSQIVKLIQKGVSEGHITPGGQSPEVKGAQAFYSKSNHKNP